MKTNTTPDLPEVVTNTTPTTTPMLATNAGKEDQESSAATCTNYLVDIQEDNSASQAVKRPANDTDILSIDISSKHQKTSS